MPAAIEHYIGVYRHQSCGMFTVEGQKQKVEEAEQMLSQRRELIAKYRNSVEEITKSEL
ncbi:putative mediator of RNA polymerase II transcription subunit 9, plant [Helianthus anomalus]